MIDPKKVLTPAVSPEELSAQMANMSDGERQMLRAGVRAELERVLGTEGIDGLARLLGRSVPPGPADPVAASKAPSAWRMVLICWAAAGAVIAIALLL